MMPTLPNNSSVDAAVPMEASEPAIGQPAARMGDMTAHGGVIDVGSDDVVIGGEPAARITDFHSCPLVDPGLAPHGGGPICAGSETVWINFLPAARVGDECVCEGPPDTIVVGEFTVLIG